MQCTCCRTSWIQHLVYIQESLRPRGSAAAIHSNTCLSPDTPGLYRGKSRDTTKMFLFLLFRVFFFPQRVVLVHLPKTCLVGLWPCKDCLVIVNVCQVKYVQMIWRWSGFLFGQNDGILCTWHFWLRRNSHFFFFFFLQKWYIRRKIISCLPANTVYAAPKNVCRGAHKPVRKPAKSSGYRRRPLKRALISRYFYFLAPTRDFYEMTFY